MSEPGRVIDLNADLGEGFGRWSLGDDAALLEVITSANVACGFHAGDPLIMRRVCAQAVERGVAVGAQVSYRDLAGFGRRPMQVSADELIGDVVYQIGALEACAKVEGTRVRYVKPHGALNNVACADPQQAAAVATAVRQYDPSLPLVAPPGTELEKAGRTAGLTTVAEAFPDRAYEPTGLLRSRTLPGAVLDDVDVITRRAVGLATTGEVDTHDGQVLSLPVRSLCLHGDNEASVAAARSVASALRAAGVTIGGFVDLG